MRAAEKAGLSVFSISVAARGIVGSEAEVRRQRGDRKRFERRMRSVPAITWCVGHVTLPAAGSDGGKRWRR